MPEAPSVAPPDYGAFPAYVRPAVTGIETQQILAVSQTALGDRSVIPLWYGESDVATPEFICKAAQDSLAAGETFYSHKRGTPELRQTLAGYMSGLYGREIGADRVSVTASGMSGIMMLFQCLIEQGDNAVIACPVWPNAQSVVRALGGEARFHSLDRVAPEDGGGWRLDVAALKAKCDARTRAIFVNSPNNPTGWVLPAEQIAELIAFARERGIWIVADEVYGRMVYDGAAAPSFLEQAGPDDPVFVVNSFSKSWAMTGWRVGWTVHPPQFGELLGNMIEFNYSCVPPFVMQAADVAIREGEPFVKRMVDYCRAGRDIVFEALPSLPHVADCAPPDASFYAFFRIEGTEDRTLAFAQQLVREAKVGVAPGTAFGPGAEGWYRLCFAQKPETIREAMRRLGEALGRL